MKTLSKFQDTINKINARQNFTTNLSNTKNRYVVSQKNIYTGKNPSLFFDLPIILKENINKNTYDSIGGWFDKETNLYHIDFNFHLSTLKYALMLAKENNQVAIYDNSKNQVIYLNDKK